MNAATFLQQFNHLAAAPNGIAKLRGLILQLAVRGKLVPQDPNDEPASELLNRLQAEKQRLIAEGQMRKRKALPLLGEPEILAQLPSSWGWARIGGLGEISPRNSAADDTVAGFVPMPLVSETYGVYPSHERRAWGEIKKGYTHFSNGDIVLAKITPCFENGKAGVIRDLPNGFGAGTTELHVLRPIPDLVVPEYIWVFFKSPSFTEEGQSQMTGTAGQKRLPRGYVEASPIPIPPLAEQKRIVAKVDELMSLCDNLKAKQQAKRTKRIALNRASLHALTEPNGPSLTAAWHRVRDHFDDLYTTPETVADLRRTILQLAVMGRLVPQDPNDEPASELLKKIQAEKQRLLAERKLRKPKALPPVDPAEAKSAIPPGWIAVRLGEVQVFTNGYAFRSEDYRSSGVGIIRMGELGDGYEIDESEMEYVSQEIADSLPDSFRVAPGDLLMGMSGSIGKLAFNRSDRTYLLNQRVGRLEPLLIEKQYLFVFLRVIAQHFLAISFGMAIKNLSTKQINEAVFPLPPLAEQKRIVVKVDQLMTLCDELEAKLQQTQTDSDNLLTAIIHERTTRSTGGL